MSFQKDKILKSPLSKYEKDPSESSSIPETPAFLNNLQGLGHDIEFIND